MDLDAVWQQAKKALESAGRDLLGFGVSAIEAAVVIAVAVFVARWLRRRTRHGLARWTLSANVVALLANAVSIGVYVVAATFVLGIFGANWTAVVALLSVGTVAISLALQDVLKNFVAGVYLLLEHPFTIGERIRIGDVSGRVENIEIRTTVLRNLNDERVIVPNATIFSGIITNRSAYRLASTTVTVKGVTAPLDQIPGDVRGALADVAALRQPPRVTIAAASAAGTDVTVSLTHGLDTDVTAAAVERLRTRFPDATITVGGS